MFVAHVLIAINLITTVQYGNHKGAVSLEGTLAGILGSLVMAGAGLALHQVSGSGGLVWAGLGWAGLGVTYQVRVHGVGL